LTTPISDRALERLLDMAADEQPPLPARYRIVRELGRGGMGVVYEAEDLQLRRRCAIKRIAAGALASDALRQRFVREALAASRLNHPHIAAVYDATPEYLSMQLVAGGPIDAEPRERRSFVAMVRDAARAVHHAHEQGIVHRDLKPSNLLVEGEHVFVVDFGLAKELTDPAQSTVGTPLGTPAFMPPEQALGRSADVDARSDVYALGATLHACLCGRPPFTGDVPAVLRAIVEQDAKPPRIDRDLDRVVLKCLAKEPERRYPTALALAEDLERWLRNEPVQAVPPSFGYRLHKLLQRRRALLRAAVAAALLTALVLVPILLRENAARRAASEGVAMAGRIHAVLEDASVFTRLGDLPSAQLALDEGIDRAREFLGRHDIPRVRHMLSRLLRARGQPDEALAELQRVVADDPSLEGPRFELGLMLAALADPTPAQREQAIAALSPPPTDRSLLNNVDLLFGRAELHRLQGRLEEAQSELEEVLAYDPMHVPARLSLRSIALAQGNQALAQQYAVGAMDLQLGFGPVYVWREQRLLPTALLGLEEALVDYSPEFADGTDAALATARRGLVQLRRGLRLRASCELAEAVAAVTAAVDDCGTALAVHDRCAGAVLDHGVCLLTLDRLLLESSDTAGAVDARQRAGADFARAVALDAGLPEAHYDQGLWSLRCAEVLRACGRAAAAQACTEAARASLQRALELAPTNWEHQRRCRTHLEEAQAR
jgi:tetratricopeptide (TPR) repeat protein/predicted Ser/Thr protein kinase